MVPDDLWGLAVFYKVYLPCNLEQFHSMPYKEQTFKINCCCVLETGGVSVRTGGMSSVPSVPVKLCSSTNVCWGTGEKSSSPFKVTHKTLQAMWLMWKMLLYQICWHKKKIYLSVPIQLKNYFPLFRSAMSIQVFQFKTQQPKYNSLTTLYCFLLKYQVRSSRKWTMARRTSSVNMNWS